MTSPRVCFVTIGATASFAALIKAVLEPGFLAALESHGYTDLLVQYGRDGQQLYQQALSLSSTRKIKVNGFDIDSAGLGRHMKRAKGDREGVVISHAGSGTILDALRINVPLIVVPNPELLDNHQVELAEALAEQEYVVHGQLNDLPKALKEAEVLSQRQRTWPPPNAGQHVKVQGLKGVIDDEMGWLD